MTIGSGLFTPQNPRAAHLSKPGSEIYDMRQDLDRALSPLAAICVEEFTNLVGLTAPGAAVLKAATATTVAVQVVQRAGLLAAGLAMLAAHPRPISFTTAGTTASDAPATVTVVGKDQNGAAQSETINLSQTAATATGTKAFSDITTITYAAADGAGATIAIGIGAAFVKAATATVTAPVTVAAAALVQTCLAQTPRQLVFTTAGGTPAHAPANVVIKGKDINGRVISETLALAQTATTATSVKFYAKIDSLTYPAGDGTAATIAITFGAAIGLARKIKARAGLSSLIREITNGAVVTNGTIVAAATDLPNGSWTPNSAANDVSDYAIYYEYDGSAV